MLSMSIKDNIKEELLNLIREERKNIDARLQMNGDVYEIACEGNFIDKLEGFANSI